MRRRFALALLLSSSLWAQTLPEAPSKVADKKYVITLGATIAANAMDAYTTSRYVGTPEHCPIEGGSPWLYGRKPAEARVIGIMSGETVAVGLMSYVLKRKRKRYWFVPMIANGTSHAAGAIHNFRVCR